MAGQALAKQRRFSAVLPLAYDAALEFDVPLAMILAVIRTESNFDPNAVSVAGAVGLMQLMPETFRYLCEEKLIEPHTADEIAIPAVNIRYGSFYLSYLKARFGEWRIALAAYNAGEGRVEEWMNDPALFQDGGLLHIPFPETAAYVSKALNYFNDYNEKYSN